jgi:hypothetical protein
VLLHSTRWLLKNLLGYALIVAGIVMSVPFIPGQGILTLFVGLAIADWPGKRRFFRWLRRFHWFERIDLWAHRKFGIRMPEHESGPPSEPSAATPRPPESATPSS